jgi:hypothetical protein
MERVLLPELIEAMLERLDKQLVLSMGMRRGELGDDPASIFTFTSARVLLFGTVASM